MHIRIDNDEIVAAVTALIQETIPNATVIEVLFTRKKGGQVYADATIELQ